MSKILYKIIIANAIYARLIIVDQLRNVNLKIVTYVVIQNVLELMIIISKQIILKKVFRSNFIVISIDLIDLLII